jgi:hypothetical protein
MRDATCMRKLSMSNVGSIASAAMVRSLSSPPAGQSRRNWQLAGCYDRQQQFYRYRGGEHRRDDWCERRFMADRPNGCIPQRRRGNSPRDQSGSHHVLRAQGICTARWAKQITPLIAPTSSRPRMFQSGCSATLRPAFNKIVGNQVSEKGI